MESWCMSRRNAFSSSFSRFQSRAGEGEEYMVNTFVHPPEQLHVTSALWYGRLPHHGQGDGRDPYPVMVVAVPYIRLTVPGDPGGIRTRTEREKLATCR
jgi:hypothetical protein